MKRLTLFRHAKSSWSDPGLPDNERPLSSRGERDAPAMAARLAARGERPDAILTSHAVRATATARAIAERLGCPAEALRIDRRLYLATPAKVLEVVREQDDGATHVLVVGHNPGLTDTANRLLPTLALDNLPTSGVVAIEVDTDRWSELATPLCRVLYYDCPKGAAAR